jgi:hypothetical protein
VVRLGRGQGDEGSMISDDSVMDWFEGLTDKVALDLYVLN